MDEDTGMNFAEFVAILSGNTDLLEKAKLNNRIMQLEKEQAAFNKERYRAERKMETDHEEMERCECNRQRMAEDWEYFNTNQANCTVEMDGNTAMTAEEIGRALHMVSKQYRGSDSKCIGHYIGLRLLVHSEYRLDGSFDRNTFFCREQERLEVQMRHVRFVATEFCGCVRVPENEFREPAQVDGATNRAEKASGGRNHRLAASNCAALGQGRRIEAPQTGVQGIAGTDRPFTQRNREPRSGTTGRNRNRHRSCSLSKNSYLTTTPFCCETRWGFLFLQDE